MKLVPSLFYDRNARVGFTLVMFVSHLFHFFHRVLKRIVLKTFSSKVKKWLQTDFTLLRPSETIRLKAMDAALLSFSASAP